MERIRNITYLLVLVCLSASPAWSLSALSGPSVGGASPANPQIATVTLTSAQIKALDLTPITLVAAQGTNKVIIPTAILIQSKFGTRAYATFGGINAAQFYYSSVSSANLIAEYNGSGANALFTAASSKFAWNSALLTVASSGWTLGAVYGLPFGTASANTPLILAVDPTLVTYNAGPILTMTVANGGTGYANGDTFTIDAGVTKLDSGDATGHVLTSSGGVVQTVAIDTAGTSYAATTANSNTGPYPTAHTSGSGDDALTVNVATATVGDGTGSVTVFYDVATLQ